MAACSDKEADKSPENNVEELLKEVEESHSQVSSLHSLYSEVYKDEHINYDEIYHFKEEISTIDLLNAEHEIYKDQNKYFLETELDVNSFQEYEISILKSEIIQREKIHQNPLAFYKQFDDDFYSHFDVTEDEDTWTFTYAADEKELDAFYTRYIEFMVDAMNMFENDYDSSEVSQLAIENFALTFLVDKETKLIIDYELKENTTFVVHENETNLERTLHSEYNHYNEAEDILIPDNALDITDGIILADVEGNDDKNPMEDAFDDVFGDRLEDNPELEEKAQAYFEGIIQAIVFQDVDAAVEVSQGTMTKEDADMQKTFFRDVYIDNTRINMGDVDVEDSYFEDLADAFISAIGKTSYQVVDAEYDGTAQIVYVTLEVEGIDDMAINYQTEEDMIEFLDEHTGLSIEEMVEKNLEVLADNYLGYEGLLDPLEIDVPVFIEGEDEFYIEPDSFLYGFVQ